MMLEKNGIEIQKGDKIKYGNFDCEVTENNNKLWLCNLSLGGDCNFDMDMHVPEELSLKWKGKEIDEMTKSELKKEFIVSIKFYRALQKQMLYFFSWKR